MRKFTEYDNLKRENEKLRAEIEAIDTKILKELMRTNICSKVKSLVNNWSGNRIDWDDYFMSIAHLASSRSPCERLHVGCVLVKNNRLVSMGYNGFLKGAPHISIVEDGHEQATVHAEQNAISDAARRGVSVEGTVAYITHYPCVHCAKILISSGIQKIYYHTDYRNSEIVEKINTSVEIVKIP